jgi:hypothetical protein
MEFSQAKVIQQGNNFHVQHGTDAGLYVQFYMESLKDEEASVAAGRPIFVDKEFIKIIPVGDRNTEICRPVKRDYDGGTPPDEERWPNQYRAFKNQQIQPHEGTPLEQWAPLTKSQVLTLKAINIHTVEQLAAVSDTNLHNVGMGARALRDNAISFLQQAKDGSEVIKQAAQIEYLTKQVEALTNQLKGFGNKPKKAKEE